MNFNLNALMKLTAIALSLVIVALSSTACNLNKSKTHIKEEAIGIPRMIDIGSTYCVPCKMMEPILEELQTEYEGRLLIEFIDITLEQERARSYGITVIPTQIFFDPEGYEFSRHIGFMSKEDILQTFIDHGLDF